MDSFSHHKRSLRRRHVVLFYRYFIPCSSEEASLDEATFHFFRTHAHHYLSLMSSHQATLCRKLGNTKGRILLSSEGINGTISFCSMEELTQYQTEMQHFDLLKDLHSPESLGADEIDVAPAAGRGKLYAGIDWKTSTVEDDQEPFPDLKVQIVKEIVNTGGVIDVRDIPKAMGNEISPEEFHSILFQAKKNGGWVKDSDDKSNDVVRHEGCDMQENEKASVKTKEVVLIDVRNTFEHAIGHFFHPHSKAIIPEDKSGHDDSSSELDSLPTPALNPNTVTFSHFDSNFCSKYADVLKDKKVLMYCTGGIRCIKASAMLKRRGIKDVSHLSGGIHRYLEKYGSDGFYKGKIMVFDQRVALHPDTIKKSVDESTMFRKLGTNDFEANVEENAQTREKSIDVVGECIECKMPHDMLSGANLCTVCRDLILICPTCHDSKYEYHCERHIKWTKAYFTFLDGFSIDELNEQHAELQRIHDSYLPPKEHKNVRKTLRKQMEKVACRLKHVKDASCEIELNKRRRCRTCFEPNDICDGLCWGFWRHSQWTQNSMNANEHESIIPVKVGDRVTPGPNWNEMRLGSKFQSTTQIVGCSILKRIKNVTEGSEERMLSCPDSDRLLKMGSVAQIKSWGSGSDELDCVAVLWDDQIIRDPRRKNNLTSKNEFHSSDDLNRSEIYRWGAMARNGIRMYDVTLSLV